MPTYNYRCKKCGDELEAFHGMTESPDIKCQCGGDTYKIISSIEGVHFKGNGFYKNSKK